MVAHLNESKRDVATSSQDADIIVEGREDEVLNFFASNHFTLPKNKNRISAAKDSLIMHQFELPSMRFICGTMNTRKPYVLITMFNDMEDSILYRSYCNAYYSIFEFQCNTDNAVSYDQLSHTLHHRCFS